MDHKIIDEMKDLLKHMKKREVHEMQLSNYSPEQQKEVYNLLVQEMESVFSFYVVVNQIKNDPDTAYGSLHI